MYDLIVSIEPTDAPWIFAHRGLWKSREDQNSKESLNLAFKSGFAVETDVRDYMGTLVISHDPLKSAESVNELKLSVNQRFALNIKEDGLISHFQNKRDIILASSSFLFDGSMPQMYMIKKLGIPHALRISEFESEIPWESQYLWIDGFESDWWMQNSQVISYLSKYHCIFVSPELHGRKYARAFDWFANLKDSQEYKFSVCTDHPTELSRLCGD